MVWMMNNNFQQFIAKYLYDFLNKQIPNLEPFWYYAAEEKNNSIVFLPDSIEYIQKYFGEEYIFSYRILQFSPKQNFSNALNTIEKIQNELSIWKFKNEIIIFNEENYYIDLIYINQKPQPLNQWCRPELINLEDESQTYSIVLGIKLKKAI